MAVNKLDNELRTQLIEQLIEVLEEKGYAVDRINDYATIAVDFPYEEKGEYKSRYMTIKVAAPRLVDKDGVELFSIDDGILAYEMRVEKDKLKEEKKKEKEKEKQKN